MLATYFFFQKECMIWITLLISKLLHNHCKFFELWLGLTWFFSDIFNCIIYESQIQLFELWTTNFWSSSIDRPKSLSNFLQCFLCPIRFARLFFLVCSIKFASFLFFHNRYSYINSHSHIKLIFSFHLYISLFHIISFYTFFNLSTKLAMRQFW